MMSVNALAWLQIFMVIPQVLVFTQFKAGDSFTRPPMKGNIYRLFKSNFNDRRTILLIKFFDGPIKMFKTPYQLMGDAMRLAQRGKLAFMRPIDIGAYHVFFGGNGQKVKNSSAAIIKDHDQ